MVYLKPKQSLGYQQHSFRLLLLYIQLVSFINSITPTYTRVTIYNCTWRIPLAFISPCQLPFVLTWNPPSCDRNRPPQSQVARKLTPLVPHLAPCTLPPKIPPFLGFSRSNAHLIRTTLQTRPTRSRTVGFLSFLCMYTCVYKQAQSCCRLGGRSWAGQDTSRSIG